MILLGFRELLPSVRQELCSYSGTPDIIDKEGRGVAMGTLSMTCLSAIEGITMLYASFLVPRP